MHNKISVLSLRKRKQDKSLEIDTEMKLKHNNTKSTETDKIKSNITCLEREHKCPTFK